MLSHSSKYITCWIFTVSLINNSLSFPFPELPHFNWDEMSLENVTPFQCMLSWSKTGMGQFNLVQNFRVWFYIWKIFKPKRLHTIIRAWFCSIFLWKTSLPVRVREDFWRFFFLLYFNTLLFDLEGGNMVHKKEKGLWVERQIQVLTRSLGETPRAERVTNAGVSKYSHKPVLRR